MSGSSQCTLEGSSDPRKEAEPFRSYVPGAQSRRGDRLGGREEEQTQCTGEIRENCSRGRNLAGP